MPDATREPPEVSGEERGRLIEFPRQREPSSLPQHNLPLHLSSFVGREREVAEVEQLLSGGTRLLTLTGPGGSGKTRLALAVASHLGDRFEDGVWWVELVPISDPTLVAQAVAQVMMIRDEPGRSLTDTLARDLATTELLLVLDNCEHMIEACASLTGKLLRACPNLQILATSREGFGIPGETNFVVPPLSLPDSLRPPTAEDSSGYAATDLFVERARAVRPGFSLTEDNAEAVARVCRRLDGMPLAIELAAAKTRVLSVEQIASRLDDRFTLLTGGRTTMAHHKTLRAAMEWSYDLLSEEEQFFFRGLSVFAGGFTLEAAGAVYEGTEETAILDLLISLSDKSLVLVTEQDGEARYGLLETIRQYALERLEHSGEAEVLRERHAEYYLSLAEEAEPELRGARQGEWLGRLEKDYDNIRAALSWTLERGRSESALRLCGTMGEFWHMLGRQSEGSRWSEAALAIGADAPKPVRAKALFVSPRTVNWHLGSVYRKLGFSSRVEAARFAAEHGLLS